MGSLIQTKRRSQVPGYMKISIFTTVTVVILCLTLVQSGPLPQVVGAGPSLAFLRNQKSSISGSTTQQHVGGLSGNRPKTQSNCTYRRIGRRRVRYCSN